MPNKSRGNYKVQQEESQAAWRKTEELCRNHRDAARVDIGDDSSYAVDTSHVPGTVLVVLPPLGYLASATIPCNR